MKAKAGAPWRFRCFVYFKQETWEMHIFLLNSWRQGLERSILNMSTTLNSLTFLVNYQALNRYLLTNEQRNR